MPPPWVVRFRRQYGGGDADSGHFSNLPLLALLGVATAAYAQVQPQLAQRYFEEVTKLCERDGGRLWGVSLCGPLVIFDPRTGTLATSQPEPSGRCPAFRVSWTAPSPGVGSGDPASTRPRCSNLALVRIRSASSPSVERSG